jgi:hypothetical protein
MADIKRLEEALIAADAAGDTEAATQLAAAIRQAREPVQVEAAPQGAPQGAYRDFAAGTNRSYASLLGMPADAVAGGLNAILPDKYDIQRPLGGSQQISELLAKAGIQTEGPRNLAGMAGEYLSLAPVAGAFGAARAGVGVAGNIAKEALSGGLATAGGYAASQLAPGNPLAEMAGAMTPAGLRAGLSAAVKPVLRGGVNPADIQANVAMAQRTGAPVTAPATVPSKPVQAIAGASSAIPGGVSEFKRAGEAAATALRSRVEKIIGGEADDISRAGRTIDKGLFGESGFVARFKGKANSLYGAMDAKVPPQTPVPASNTYQYLSSSNKGVTGAPEMSTRMFVDDALQADASAFFADIHTNGGSIPYAALKKFRTRVGDALADPDLIGSEQRATMKRLYASLTDDMADVAARNGAQKEFKRANDYYSAGTKRIEDFFESVDRKVSGEDVYKSLIGDNPQSATKILTLKKSLNPDEWNYVRKTVITRMGKPAASAATEGGPGFSPATFLTNYEKMKKNGVADAIFGTGQFRKDINDVAKYTSNLRASADILANPSNTAARGLTASVMFYALGLPTTAIVGSALGGGTGALAGAALAATGIGSATYANSRIAKALNDPKFVNWLATATRIPPARLPGHIGRLATIAGNDPEMASFLADYATAIGSQQ